MDIAITKSPTAATRSKPADADLGFGQILTDHMFLMDYSTERGWHSPRIEPYHDLTLDPVAIVLHYNQQVFEGLKAYHLPDGGIGLFRPDKNVERMNASTERMVMPSFDAEVFLAAVKELVLLDRYWLPTSEGTAIYIRPTMIATEAALRASSRRRPTYSSSCSAPSGRTTRRASTRRASSSRTSTFARREEASGTPRPQATTARPCTFPRRPRRGGIRRSCGSTPWSGEYVEEVGTSNIFFVIEDELVTPSLSGSILSGVTRDSVMQVARNWDIEVTERRVSMEEVAEGCRSGRISEAFATGTAAVVSPIGEIGYMGEDIPVGEGETGPLARRLYDEIVGIQYGYKDDPFGWRVRIA